MKFFQVFAVLAMVLAMGSGCASTYKYENSGGTTETMKKTPDGGYERTATYHNKGSGRGTPEVIGSGSVSVGYGRSSSRRYNRHGGGYSGLVTPGPSREEVMSLIP